LDRSSIFTAAIMHLANASNPDKEVSDHAKHCFEQASAFITAPRAVF
jgi:hypothetical protein